MRRRQEMEGDRRSKAEESPLSMSKAAVRNSRELAMQQKRHSPTLGMIVKDVTSVEDLMKRVSLPEQFQVTAKTCSGAVGRMRS